MVCGIMQNVTEQQAADATNPGGHGMDPPSVAIDEELLADRRDVKVKLPAALVLRLYYLKLTTSLNYSDVVEDALTRYFADVDAEVIAVPGLAPIRRTDSRD